MHGKIIASVAEVLNFKFERENLTNIEELLPLNEVYRTLETSPPAGFHGVSRTGLLVTMLALGDWEFTSYDYVKGIRKGTPPRVLGGGVPREKIKNLLDAYDLKVNLQQSSKNTETSTPPTSATAILDEYDQRHFDSDLKYITQNAACLKNRRLMVMSTGTLGLAHKSLRPGDAIAILHGSKFPIALRELSVGRYQVISQAYVLSIMLGEAVTWAEDEADEFLLV